MPILRTLSVVALALSMLGIPATAQAPTGGAAGQQSEADKKAAAEADKKKAPSYAGQFQTGVIGGGAVNELTIPVQPNNLQQLPERKSQQVNAIGYPQATKARKTPF